MLERELKRMVIRNRVGVLQRNSGDVWKLIVIGAPRGNCSWARISDIGGIVNRLMTREYSDIGSARYESCKFPLQCEIVLLRITGLQIERIGNDTAHR